MPFLLFVDFHKSCNTESERDDEAPQGHLETSGENEKAVEGDNVYI